MINRFVSFGNKFFYTYIVYISYKKCLHYVPINLYYVKLSVIANVWWLES